MREYAISLIVCFAFILSLKYISKSRSNKTAEFEKFTEHSRLTIQDVNKVITKIQPIIESSPANSKGQLLTPFQTIQKQRQAHIKETCAAHNFTNTIADRAKFNHQLEVLESKSLLFCVSPKTGTSNWKRLFVATYLNKTLDEVFITDDENNEFNEKLYTTIPRWKNFYKSSKITDFENRLINVRHPLARLYSGWKDKFHDHPENKKYGSLLTKFFGRFDRLIRVFESGDFRKDEHARVSFKAFVLWIVDSKSVGIVKDYHWNSIFNICSPCFAEYNLISKIEEADSTADFVLKKIDISESIGNFPKAYKTSQMSNNEKSEEFDSKLKTLYSENQIDGDLICKIYHAYKMDFLLFEYEISPFLSENSECSM